MTVRLRLAFGLACLMTPLMSFGSAAQGKRPWVDPPADLDTRTHAAPVEASPKSHRDVSPTEQADGPAAATKAAEGRTTQPVRVAKKKVAPSRTATVPARQSAPLRQVKAAQLNAAPKARVAVRGAATGRNKRVSVAGRPLELMNLQTIELPDGRRFNVLTRPDRQMIEEFLPRP
jgi:hypothetical protein